MSARMDGHSLVNILRAIGSVPKNRARQFKPDNPILQHFNSRTVTFALPTFSPGHALVIRTIEFLTGKIRLLWLARKFLSTRRALDGTMWERLLDFLEFEIVTPNAEIAQIPATGAVVVVANHPFGFVDGLVLGALVSQVRPDLKILTRAFRGFPPEVRENMVPVAHSHDVDFTARNIAVRKEVMKHLNAGGAVILFPAGRVATSKSPFGRAIEYSWTPFTAKMILRSDATVVPVFFPGQNSRLFQIAQTISPVLRQSLLMREITTKIGKPIHPIVGPAIGRTEIDAWRSRPKEFMSYLRALTLSLERHSSSGI